MFYVYNLQVEVEISFSRTSSGASSSSTCAFYLIKLYCNEALPSGHKVVPVLTLPLLITTEGDEDEEDGTANAMIMGLGREISAQCVREARVGGASVLVFECPGNLGIGGKVQYCIVQHMYTILSS